MKIKKTKSQMGKASRAAGNRFELRVNEDMEKKGWICAKWTKNVEFNIEHQGDAVQIIPDEVVVGKLIKAKPKFVFNPQLKRRMPMGMSSGFPDFIAYRVLAIDISKSDKKVMFYEIIGVESKMNGILDKEEKEKCKWYLENNIFSKILIAFKGERRGEIKYRECEE